MSERVTLESRQRDQVAGTEERGFLPTTFCTESLTHIKSSEISSLVLLSAYRWDVVVAVLLVVIGPNTTNNTATTTFQQYTRGGYCS